MSGPPVSAEAVAAAADAGAAMEAEQVVAALGAEVLAAGAPVGLPQPRILRRARGCQFVVAGFS
jgi:hypothetical protein